jgi:TetR/AcrR family transcriptional repressor of uid operon
MAHKMNGAVILSTTIAHRRAPITILPMPRIRPETAERRRRKILDAAHRAFNTYGINVSIEQICAEAGISKGNFYGYFENKDAVILAIAEVTREQIDALAELRTADQLVDRLVGAGPGGDVGPSRFELEAWTYSLSHPALRMLFRDSLRGIDRSLEKSLAHLTVSTEPQNPLPASDAAQILRIFAVGMMASKAMDEQIDRKHIAASLRQLVDLIVRPVD